MVRRNKPKKELHKKTGDPLSQVSELPESDKRLEQGEGPPGDTAEQYRLLFSANPQPMLIYDLGTLAILEVNETIVREYGYSREEFLAMTIKDIRPEEEIPELVELISQLPHGYAFHPTRKHRKKDGTLIDVEIASHGLTFNGKKARLVLANNITERRRAEEALRESEERFKFVLEGSQLGFWDWNINTGEVKRNERWAEMLGYTLEEIEFSTSQWSDLLHPDDRAGAWKSIQDHLEGRTAMHEMEYRLRTKDGRYKWVLDRARITARDPQGRPLRMSGTHNDITERKQAEELLRQEKNFSDAIIDSLPGIFYLFDESGKFIRWNQRFEEVAGYSEAEMAALHPLAFFTEEERELIAGKIQKVFAEGEAEAEAFFVTKSGEKIPYYFTGLRTVVADTPYLLGLGIDITARRQAKEALRESEERYRRITGAVTDYIYTVMVEDGQAVHTEHSPPCVAVTGYTSEEFAADPFLWVNMVLEEDRDLVRRHAARLLAGEDPGPIEHRLRRKDGAVRWVSNMPVLHRDASGRLISYDGLVSDITARKLAEEALRESEEFNRQIISNVEEGILVFDRDFRFVLWNPFMERLSGLPAKEVLGRHPLESFPFLEEQGIYALMEKAMAGEGGATPDYAYYVPSTGKSGWAMNYHVPYRNAQGEIIGVIGTVHDITERKRGEEALRESEERYRRITGAVTDYIYTVMVEDGQAVHTEHSPPCVAVTGYTSEEFAAEPFLWVNMVLEEDKELVRRHAARLLAGEDPGPIEHRLRRKDGAVRWVSNVPVLHRDSSGQLISYDGLVSDITARKEAEEALRESRADLNRAQAVAHTGSWRMDVRRNELTWSDETYRMFGIPQGTPLTYETFLAAVHPEDREYVDRKWTAALKGEAYDIEHRILVGDTVKWVRERAELEVDSQGLILGGFGTVQDITARKLAEEALKKEEQKYRSLYQEFQAILNTIPDTLCLLSPDLKIVWGNEATALDIHRSSLSEIIGQHCYPLRHDRFEPCDNCPVVRCFQSGKLETEEVFSHGNIWELRAVPLYNDLGECRGAIEVARNITERKQAEEERRKLEEQMRHVQKLESLGVLAGGIAHDFNNLLMTVLGNAELALLELSPAAGARPNVEEIRKAARRAADLCRQMLAYSGKGKFVVEKLNLSELVKEMAHMLEVSISKKALLRYHFPKNLPVVEADPTQLRQVIMNLITNASEAIGEENGVIRVSTGVVECDRDYLDQSYYLAENLVPGSFVFLEVTDTGSGMDAATREKIFDPFFTTKFTGRGLGLAAVLGIVRGHKGAIRVYSEPGKGSTFRILLPAGRGKASQTGLKTGEEEPAWQGQGTILLIDDEEAIRRLGAQMLERLGFEVLTAADGREGLDLCRAHGDRLVCVILDLTMPYMGGEETMQGLQRLRGDLRVILSSGYDEQEVTQRFASKGLAGFIQKPYTLKRLREELQRVLG
ncbi:MAG: PAS domain S-box protein [Thermodesulfobacteriota bacterium]